MGWRIAALVLVAAGLLAALLPVRLHLRLAQAGLTAEVGLELAVGGLRLRRRATLPRRCRTGERAETGLGRGRRPDGRRLARAAAPGLGYLARVARCERLCIRVEVGGLDASDSALLAGLGWGVVYALLAQLGRWVELDPGAVEVAVVPNFQRPMLRTDLDCILRVRLGEATWAAGMVLCAAPGRRALLARIRERWRRRGDRTGG